MQTVRSAEAESFSPTLAPGTIVGGYAFVRCIGAGGLGIVYEARHQQLDKPVAVKALKSGLAADPVYRERFLREGRTAAKLRHPNVVDVFDVALDGETPYLVMELLTGEDLSLLIARHSPLAVESTMDILIPVISALRFAHEHGVLHRDLKPQNVFLNEGPNGVVTPKVVDFGVSKVLDEHSADLTHSNMFVGTPNYMSPEQARADKHIDHRCDQFSLGVIAYECLSGWRPFTGDSLLALLNAVVHHEPPSVHSVAPEVCAEVAAVIARMMAKAPQDRYPNMHAVGAALLPFASPRVRLAYERDFQASAMVLSDAPVASPVETVPNTLRQSPSPWELDRVRIAATGRFNFLFGIAAICGIIGLAWAVVKRSAPTGDTIPPAPLVKSGQVANQSGLGSQPGTPSDLASSPPLPPLAASDSSPSPEALPNQSVASSKLRGRPFAEMRAGRTAATSSQPRAPAAPAPARGAADGQGATAAFRPTLDPLPGTKPERGVNGALILP